MCNTLRDLTEEPQAAIVLAIGSTGPHSKNTALLLRPDGTPSVLVKIGETAASIALMKNEIEWLERLSNNVVIRSSIPDLISHGQVNGFYYLAQRAGLGLPFGRELTSVYFQFLQSLQQHYGSTGTYGDCHMRTLMWARYSSLKDILSPVWKPRARQALDLLDKALLAVEFPLTMAHGDFAHWNIRRQGDGIFVFDWEYAHEGYLPLYDHFHFYLLPAVRSRKVGLQYVRALIRKMTVMGTKISLPGLNYVPQQLLAYLLDISLLFLESTDADEEGDLVVSRFALLIDQYESWGADGLT